jgi:hypothetical protein
MFSGNCEVKSMQQLISLLRPFNHDDLQQKNCRIRRAAVRAALWNEQLLAQAYQFVSDPDALDYALEMHEQAKDAIKDARWCLLLCYLAQIGAYPLDRLLVYTVNAQQQYELVADLTYNLFAVEDPRRLPQLSL